jgi:C1A family cysteine protease
MGNYVSYYWYGVPSPPPLPPLTHRRFGWKRDKNDERDHKYSPPEDLIPDTCSLKEKMPAVLDQGDLGSCTANALANAVRFCEKEEKHSTIDEDCGSAIRDGIKTINKNGVCAESIWPYDIAQFKTKPPKECYEQARLHKSIKYLSLAQDVEHMKNCLNSGYPIIIGFDVFPSMDSVQCAKTGVVPDPEEDEKPIGGHCVLVTGYNDKDKRFEFQNSWGKTWGQRGFGTLSYDYLTNPDIAGNFWTIRFVE